jgi:phosphoglycolate phosphatase
MSRIEAAVFDVDGTIVDTSEFIIQAHAHTLAHHGLPERTREEIASQVGKKLEDGYAFLAPGGEVAKLLEVHRSFQAENPHLIKPFEHANDALSKIHSSRELGIYSARKHIGTSLEIAGIDKSLFSVIVDGTMYEKGKPDPEGLLLALGKLGVIASKAVMIGDAAVDIQAGKAAGVRATIAITHGFGTREELESASPDYIIDSLDVLPGLLDKIEQ